MKRLKIAGLKQFRIKFKEAGGGSRCIFRQKKEEEIQREDQEEEKKKEKGLRLCSGCDGVESGFFVSGFKS